jgi:hypothetical protein
MKNHRTGSKLKIAVAEPSLKDRIICLESEIKKINEFKNPICGKLFCKDTSVTHGHLFTSNSLVDYIKLLHSIGFKTTSEEDEINRFQKIESEIEQIKKPWWKK